LSGTALPDCRFSKTIISLAAIAVRVLIKSQGAAMRISARNQIKGKILQVTKGATTSHVRVEIAPGQVVTASITNEAVEDLDLRQGKPAMVVIKASDVMIVIE
jgi:molybdopterin-binding protein